MALGCGEGGIITRDSKCIKEKKKIPGGSGEKRQKGKRGLKNQLLQLRLFQKGSFTRIAN